MNKIVKLTSELTSAPYSEFLQCRFPHKISDNQNVLVTSHCCTNCFRPNTNVHIVEMKVPTVFLNNIDKTFMSDF